MDLFLGFGLFGILGFVGFGILRRVISETEHNRSANEGVLFADFALEKALIGPVQKLEIAAMDNKPRWSDVGLDDVFQFRASVF